MIVSFRHKGLLEVFASGKTSKIGKALLARCNERLDALDAATQPSDMRIPGFDYHALKGHNPTRYSVHVNGPWCITFAFDGTNAIAVDLEQYH